MTGSTPRAESVLRSLQKVRRGSCAATFSRRTSRKSTHLGFSLVELLVVLAVVVLMTGILLPVIREVKENAHRVICASNMKQIGVGFVLYGSDYNRLLPPSHFAEHGGQQEMMAAHRGPVTHQVYDGWDGIGILFRDNYCPDSRILYCPSHHGHHTHDKYELDYARPSGDHAVYTNYHYVGHLYTDGSLRRLTDYTDTGLPMSLLSDGMRTRLDFNHRVGTNVLWADGSVSWQDHEDGDIVLRLPYEASEQPELYDATFEQIWSIISGEEDDEPDTESFDTPSAF